MCGFAGEYIFDPASRRASLDTAVKMAETLGHRGPDSSGAFASPCGRCAMAFRRLKVMDLQRGEQPISTADGHITLVFNGEIYNYVALRNELETQGVSFSSTGDTEVLLEMYQRHGLTMLDKLEGMFAIAIFDGNSNCLHLIRDRLGVKPLWIARTPDRIVFASEVKALGAHDAIEMTVNTQAISYYLNFGYVPAPMSIWRDITKLKPASVLSADSKDIRQNTWWRPPADIAVTDRREAVQLVQKSVIAAVMKRLRSDVPLGVLLSGGVDSSIVAAISSAILNGDDPTKAFELVGSSRALKTFCAGFAESTFDERPKARAVAEHIGSEHIELQISPDPAMLDMIINAYDEPFGDSSALATMLLAAEVRKHVTVALGGDGGDEAFGGYDRYRAMWMIQHMGAFKSTALILAAALLDKFAPRDEKSKLRRLVRFGRGVSAPPTLRYLGFRQLMPFETFGDLITDDLAMAADMNEHIEWFADCFDDEDYPTDFGAAQRCDILTYLPDDLLVKADIATMANSLELRSPMLDHNVIELGLGLDDRLKVNARGGKTILRDAFSQLLPPEVFTQSKAGFGVPIDSWLKGPLLGELKSVLLDQSFIDRGWLRRTAIERMIDQHVAGTRDHRHSLWALLILGKWASRL